MLSVKLQDLKSRTSHMEQTTGIHRLPKLPGVFEVLACIRLMALKNQFSLPCAPQHNTEIPKLADFNLIELLQVHS